MGFVQGIDPGDDDACHYIGERLKLEGETESMGVCTKERKGMTAEVLMGTPCTKSLGGESGGSKHGGDVWRRLCRFLLMMMFITISARDSKRNDGFYSK